MRSYLKFLKFGSLAIVALSCFGFMTLLVMSGSLTIGGEILLFLLITPIIYYLILFGLANFVLKNNVLKLIPVVVLSIFFFSPFLAVLDIESAANFVIPSIDMK